MDKHGTISGLKPVLGRWAAAVMLAACFAAASSCAKEEVQKVAVRKVLIVYIASDNDLSVSGYRKVEKLKSGFGGAEGTKLYIFQDPADDLPRLITLTPEGETVQLLEEVDSADAGILGGLCGDIAAANPEAVFGLLIFSHSTGWLPHGTFETPTRSLAVDGTRGMELAQLSAQLPDGMFEYIILESCYSAGIEICYALRDKTDYLAVSSAEILDPGFTYVYDRYLTSLFAFDGPPVKFMQAAFGEFESNTGVMQSATFSIIDVGRTAELACFLREHAQYTPVTPDKQWQYFDRNVTAGKSVRLVYDFADYYSHGLDSKAVSELDALVNACVVYKASTPEFLRNDERHDGFLIKNHSGLTAFVPQHDIPELNEAYRQTEWYREVFD